MNEVGSVSAVQPSLCSREIDGRSDRIANLWGWLEAHGYVGNCLLDYRCLLLLRGLFNKPNANTMPHVRNLPRRWG